MPDPRSKDEYSFGPEPEALFDNHHYTEIVKQIAPVLAKIGEHALSLFCDLLEEAVNLSRKAQGGKTAEDFSYIWRPAIEDHIQNHIRKPKEILVSVVRDVAESMMERKGKQVLDIIESKPFNIFKRIGLYLRRKWLEVDPDGTAKRITDHNFFDNNDMHH